MKLGKVVIAGTGLIGGSFALALKQASAVNQVVGIGRTRNSLERAQQLGVIDAIADDWASAMHGADLVLLAMPVGGMEAALQALLPHLQMQTVITDAGSTKGDVVDAATRVLGSRVSQFVPGHPIAGAEKSGAAAALADLYQGKRVVLTPLPASDTHAVAKVRAAWEACGAKVSQLEAALHDRIFAAVSHLPHVLAYALVHEFAARDNADELFGYAAGGFRDFTRIASSHPEMWRDICIANRSALIAELDAYTVALLRMRTLLAAADAQGLEAVFDSARVTRDAWLNGGAPNANQTTEE